MKNTERIILWVLLAAIIIGGGAYYWFDYQKCKNAIIDIDEEAWEKENNHKESVPDYGYEKKKLSFYLKPQVITGDTGEPIPMKEIIVANPYPNGFMEDIQTLMNLKLITPSRDNILSTSKKGLNAAKKIFEKYKVPYTVKCIEV